MTTDVWAHTTPMSLEVPARSPLLDAKVMMVDDEPLMTDLIQTHLEDAGYVNFVVTNEPAQAMAMLRRERPGVLLLDLMMPAVSGFDVLAAVRADRELRYTPVIVLTASTGAESKLRALQLGATDFLAKPVDESELVLRVRNTLAFHEYRERLVHFDRVTGLADEELFEHGVDTLLERQPLQGGVTALFSITVPECRQLRESLGRSVADGLATVLARRLSVRATPANAPFADAAERITRVARLGEQHFGLVLDGLADADAVEQAARGLLAALAETVPLGLHEIAPTPWIGVAMSPTDGLDAASLRQSADLAATHGLQHGLAQITYASSELNARSLRRITLGSQLRSAASRNELQLHYQPKVSATTGRIVGVEALLRWQHPELGMVSPAQFIPLAEEFGHMPSIGRWVLEAACRDLADWVRRGCGDLRMAVNVSKPQLVTGDLVAIVREVLNGSGIPPERLILELTESMLIEDVQQSLNRIKALKSAGVALSIDDFGTGYSSLAYLKRFPVDELKIDRSFVKDLPGDPPDRALVRSVVELGHSLQLSVTAEGVETEAQRRCVEALGCDTFQGFLFSRPVTAAQLWDMLEAAQPRKPLVPAA